MNAAAKIVRQKLIGRYPTHISTDLFRVGANEKVILRDYAKQQKLGRHSFDIKLNPEDGLAHPATGEYFNGPNGASLRPNTQFMQEIIRKFRGRYVTVYMLKEGTKLPEDLVLLHEHSDHYSLQCTKPMKLSDLNKKLTQFCSEKGEKMSQAEFCERFPLESAQFV